MKPFYYMHGRIIGYNPGKVYNCSCRITRGNQYGQWHAKSCLSRRNVVWKYKMSWLEWLKSKFVPAEKIFNFYQDEDAK